MFWCAFLLEDKSVMCNAFDSRQHLARQQDITVILTINFHSRVNEDEIGNLISNLLAFVVHFNAYFVCSVFPR